MDIISASHRALPLDDEDNIDADELEARAARCADRTEPMSSSWDSTTLQDEPPRY